ncbi:hypothetical protein B0H11DRAFT_2224048 [Mycena galericulata]|nr:hypothetical protein B0H11DRAFT_2224048 [Mycena galericulata]
MSTVYAGVRAYNPSARFRRYLRPSVPRHPLHRRRNLAYALCTQSALRWHLPTREIWLHSIPSRLPRHPSPLGLRTPKPNTARTAHRSPAMDDVSATRHALVGANTSTTLKALVYDSRPPLSPFSLFRAPSSPRPRSPASPSSLPDLVPSLISFGGWVVEGGDEGASGARRPPYLCPPVCKTSTRAGCARLRASLPPSALPPHPFPSSSSALALLRLRIHASHSPSPFCASSPPPFTEVPPACALRPPVSVPTCAPPPASLPRLWIPVVARRLPSLRHPGSDPSSPPFFQLHLPLRVSAALAVVVVRFARKCRPREWRAVDRRCRADVSAVRAQVVVVFRVSGSFNFEEEEDRGALVFDGWIRMSKAVVLRPRRGRVRTARPRLTPCQRQRPHSHAHHHPHTHLHPHPTVLAPARVRTRAEAAAAHLTRTNARTRTHKRIFASQAPAPPTVPAPARTHTRAQAVAAHLHILRAPARSIAPTRFASTQLRPRWYGRR